MIFFVHCPELPTSFLKVLFTRSDFLGDLKWPPLESYLSLPLSLVNNPDCSDYVFGAFYPLKNTCYLVFLSQNVFISPCNRMRVIPEYVVPKFIIDHIRSLTLANTCVQSRSRSYEPLLLFPYYIGSKFTGIGSRVSDMTET